jgi:hypothetical protein
MSSISQNKSRFVKSAIKYVGPLLNPYRKIYGVSLAPVCNSKSNCLGDMLVCLGKERDGFNVDKFNYFGGKIGDKTDIPFEMQSDEEKLTTILEVLFEEVCEEFGIILNSKSFKKGLLGIIENPYLDGASLVFVCRMCGIDGKVWKNVMNERVENHTIYHPQYLPWRLQEMSEIKYFKVKDLDEEIASSYVMNTKKELLKFDLCIAGHNLVEYSDFKLTTGFKL